MHYSRKEDKFLPSRCNVPEYCIQFAGISANINALSLKHKHIVVHEAQAHKRKLVQQYL